MKRSEINNAIRYALNTLSENRMRLPAFAYWTMGDWEKMAPELDNMRAINLGWDVTDFGSDDFAHVGSVLFNVRNGKAGEQFAGTPYAEKIIFQRHETEQEIPYHFHKLKMEDIINRGGGILVLELYNSTADGKLDKSSEIKVKMDGIICSMPAGSIVEIAEGRSITLHPGLYHRFWAKKGAGDIIIGEVSSINDDNTDNVFLEASRRFSLIDEDEPALVPLCNEY